MKKVFKYEFEFGDYFSVLLPQRSEILTCKQIDGKWYLWAVVDDDSPWPIEKRNFRLCGTGHHLAEANYRWITTEMEVRSAITFGTEVRSAITFLWHIFEII